jgi:calmodulin
MQLSPYWQQQADLAAEEWRRMQLQQSQSLPFQSSLPPMTTKQSIITPHLGMPRMNGNFASSQRPSEEFDNFMDLIFSSTDTLEKYKDVVPTDDGDKPFCPNIEDFLAESFLRADSDASGCLSHMEFWKMVKGLPLNLSNTEIFELKMKMDKDGDGGITWEEFSSIAPLALHEIYDKPGADHHPGMDWCCLPAGDGSFYWYNKRTQENLKDKPDVVVEWEAQQAQHKMAPDIKDYLIEQFQLADADASGDLNRAEFYELVEHLNLELTGYQTMQLEKKLDSNSDGSITWEEFIARAPSLLKEICGEQEGYISEWSHLENEDEGTNYWYNKLTGETSWETPAAVLKEQQMDPGFTDYLKSQFKVADADGSGQLTRRELLLMLKKLPLKLSSAEQHELLEGMDADGSGEVSWSEFIDVVPAMLQQISAAHAEENGENGETQNKPHPGQDWCELITPTGEIYWYNKASRENVREKPKDLIEWEAGQEPLMPGIEDYLSEQFEVADEDASGCLSRSEFVAMMATMELGLKTEQLSELLSRMDADDSGSVTWAELVKHAPSLLAEILYEESLTQADDDDESSGLETDWCKLSVQGGHVYYNKRTGHSQPEKPGEIEAEEAMKPNIKKYLARQFKKADSDGSGHLGLAEFAELLEGMALHLTKEEVEVMRKRMDIDSDGDVSWGEFVREAPTIMAELAEQHDPDPSNPMQDWCEVPSPSGKVYWFNKRTGVTSWDKPNEIVEWEAREAQKLLAPDMKAYLKRCFKEADDDGSGCLSTDEFVALLKSMSLGLEPEQVEAVRAQIDNDNSGSVTWSEFVSQAEDILKKVSGEAVGDDDDDGDACPWVELVATVDERGAVMSDGDIAAEEERAAAAGDDELWATSKMSTKIYYYNKITNESRWDKPEELTLSESVQPDIKQYLKKQFKLADKDRSGHLSRSEFVQLLKTMPLHLSDEEVDTAVGMVDADNDGSIGWHEFVNAASDILKKIYSENEVAEEEEWAELTSKGRPYWYNKRTGETRSTKPEAPSSAPLVLQLCVDQLRLEEKEEEFRYRQERLCKPEVEEEKRKRYGWPKKVEPEEGAEGIEATPLKMGPFCLPAGMRIEQLQDVCATFCNRYARLDAVQVEKVNERFQEQLQHLVEQQLKQQERECEQEQPVLAATGDGDETTADAQEEAGDVPPPPPRLDYVPLLIAQQRLEGLISVVLRERAEESFATDWQNLVFKRDCAEALAALDTDPTGEIKRAADKKAGLEGTAPVTPALLTANVWYNKRTRKSQWSKPRQRGLQAFLQREFRKFDDDGSGTLEGVEFVEFFESLGLGLQQSDAIQMLGKVDSDGGGSVSWEEFIEHAPELLMEIHIQVWGEDESHDWCEIEVHAHLGHAKPALRGATPKVQAVSALTEGATSNEQRSQAADNDGGNADLMYYNKRTGETRSEKPLQANIELYLKSCFDAGDEDGSGCLGREEFFTMVASMGLGITEEQTEAMIEEIDEDGSGAVGWKEFVTRAPAVLKDLYAEGEENFEQDWVEVFVENSNHVTKSYWYNKRSGKSQWVAPEKPDFASHLRKKFEAADYDGSGHLNHAEFFGMVQDLGLGLKETQVYEMLKQIDADGSGSISWDEFAEQGPALLQQVSAEADAADNDDGWCKIGDEDDDDDAKQVATPAGKQKRIATRKKGAKKSGGKRKKQAQYWYNKRTGRVQREGPVRPDLELSLQAVVLRKHLAEWQQEEDARIAEFIAAHEEEMRLQQEEEDDEVEWADEFDAEEAELAAAVAAAVAMAALVAAEAAAERVAMFVEKGKKQAHESLGLRHEAENHVRMLKLYMQEMSLGALSAKDMEVVGEDADPYVDRAQASSLHAQSAADGASNARGARKASTGSIPPGVVAFAKQLHALELDLTHEEARDLAVRIVQVSGGSVTWSVVAKEAPALLQQIYAALPADFQHDWCCVPASVEDTMKEIEEMRKERQHEQHEKKHQQRPTKQFWYNKRTGVIQIDRPTKEPTLEEVFALQFHRAAPRETGGELGLFQFQSLLWEGGQSSPLLLPKELRLSGELVEEAWDSMGAMDGEGTGAVQIDKFLSVVPQLAAQTAVMKMVETPSIVRSEQECWVELICEEVEARGGTSAAHKGKKKKKGEAAEPKVSACWYSLATGDIRWSKPHFPDVQQELTLAFRVADSDNSNCLSSPEYTILMEALGLHNGLSRSMVEELETRLDDDQSGTIAFTEFVHAAPGLLQEMHLRLPNDPKKDWCEFKLGDEAGSGPGGARSYWYNKREGKARWQGPV